MLTTTKRFRQGRKDDIWTKYCGFLDLGPDEFMAIQERLLMQQLDLIGKSEIGKKFMGERAPTSVQEFQRRVPITTYEDYEPYLGEKRADALPQEPYLWAHTSGRSGRFKWIPYTRQAYEKLGDRVLAGVILAAARRKGEVRIKENDVFVYNTPPRPYASGVALRALAGQFNFRFVPPLEETEEMTFQERIESGFQVGLVTGIDILGSLAVVLVKMGERFAEGARTTSLSAQLLYPRVAVRLIKALIRSKLARRSMLPKDIWAVKAIPSGGMDISIYKDKIAHYWGAAPHEQYASTEEITMAIQTWNKKGLTFFPDAAFLEFVPEDEWDEWQRDPTYIPRTALMNEVEPNKRYEVLLTNFYGKPLLRYRMHDIIKFTSLQDQETGIRLPQMVFVGRSSDFIDLAGFTGPIDEKIVWQAIVNTEMLYEEWSMRKEYDEDRPILHLYIELRELVGKETVQARVHKSLKDTNPFYADYASVIETQPLKVTVLPPGTFQAYMTEKQAAGADLAHLKPPHMNAPDEDIRLLLRLGEQIG